MCEHCGCCVGTQDGVLARGYENQAKSTSVNGDIVPVERFGADSLLTQGTSVILFWSCWKKEPGDGEWEEEKPGELILCNSEDWIGGLQGSVAVFSVGY